MPRKKQYRCGICWNIITQEVHIQRHMYVGAHHTIAEYDQRRAPTRGDDIQSHAIMQLGDQAQRHGTRSEFSAGINLMSAVQALDRCRSSSA